MGILQAIHGLKLYQSIEDLPIWNYHKVQTTGELRYLIRKGRPKKDVLLKLWERLQEEFTARVGLTDSGNALMQKSKRLMLLELKKIIAEIAGKSTSRIKVDLEQLSKELTNRSDTTTQDLEDQAAILTKWSGIDINTKVMSTLRFYKLLELFQKEAETYEQNT